MVGVLILTGGWGLVSNILHDEILADDAEWVKPSGQTALWYYTSCSVRSGKETLVVSMPHPNRAAKCWTLELEKILRETGRSQRLQETYEMLHCGCVK